MNLELKWYQDCVHVTVSILDCGPVLCSDKKNEMTHLEKMKLDPKESNQGFNQLLQRLCSTVCPHQDKNLDHHICSISMVLKVE